MNKKIEINMRVPLMTIAGVVLLAAIVLLTADHLNVFSEQWVVIVQKYDSKLFVWRMLCMSLLVIWWWSRTSTRITARMCLMGTLILLEVGLAHRFFLL